MPDLEKVIKGLECHAEVNCVECPYRDGWRTCPFGETLLADALALLKGQAIGHWIFLTDCSNSGVYCSECNTKVFDSYPFKKKLSYFCPHCGTRMEGEIERR